MKRSSLKSFDGADGFAHDRRDLFDGEITHHPQNEHLSLVRRQAGAQLVHALAPQGVECLLFDVAARLVEPVGVSRRGRRAPGRPSALVDQPPVSDREHPGPELVLRALESRQRGEDTEEHLTGDVIGLGRPLQAKIAANDRGEVGVEALKSPRRAGARRVENAVETVADGQSDPLPPFGSSLSSS